MIARLITNLSCFRPSSILLLFGLLVSASTFAQQLVEREFVLPVVADATISSLSPDANYGTNPDLIALSWETNTTYFTFRSLFRFDLSQLPQGELLGADLELFATTNSGNPTHYGHNEALILQIIEPWDQETVTWNSQPASTTDGGVFMPRSDYPQQDYQGIDVSQSMAAAMQESHGNYGFVFQLQSETIYKSLNFASSDHFNDSLHPVLRVTMLVEEVSTSTHEVNLLGDVGLSPNPATTTQPVTLDVITHKAGEVTLETYDMTGRLLSCNNMGWQSAGEHNLRIPVQGWADGMLVSRVLIDDQSAGTFRHYFRQ